MKKTLLILLLFSLNSFSQNKMELIYKVKSSGTVYDPRDQKISAIYEYLIKADEELEDLQFILRIKGNESIWFLNDSDSYPNSHMGKAYAGGETYYFSTKEKVFTQQKEFLGNYFIVKTEPRNFNWELIDETKEILGYTCKKAISKETKIIEGNPKTMETIAWYCPDLKQNIGPQYFGGLDGLILELTDKNRKFYCAEIRSNESMSMFIIEKPSKGKLVTEEEFSLEMKRIANEKFPELKD